jgi:MFS family permease
MDNKVFKWVGFPFHPKKLPFFYGWVILFAGIIGVLMSVPGQTIGVSVFTDYLIQALPLNRDNLSLTYLLGTVSSGFLIGRAGRLYDKYGGRYLGIFTGAFLGLVLFYLSNVEYITRFFNGLFGAQSGNIAIAFIVMVAGFFLLRFFGQGLLTMLSRNIVMKWFEEKRGLVNTILAASISIGFSYAPRLFDDMIEQFTWQGAWQVMAIIIGVGFVLFAFVFFRDNPQECGLKPDGSLASKNKHYKDKQIVLKEFDLPEARRTYSFWIFNLTLAMNALFVTAFTFHVVDIFEKASYTRDQAVNIFLPAAVIAFVLNLIFSPLSDYIKLKYILLIELLGLLASMLAIFFLKNVGYMYYVIIAGQGISQGMFGIVSAVTWPRFFGVRHLGAITGYVMGWTVVGSAIGPYFFSLSLKYLGNYAWAAGFCFIVTAILFIMGFRADNVNRED